MKLLINVQEDRASVTIKTENAAATAIVAEHDKNKQKPTKIAIIRARPTFLFVMVPLASIELLVPILLDWLMSCTAASLYNLEKM